MASDKEFFVAAFETILRNVNPAQLSIISESLAEACVKASRETIANAMGSEPVRKVIDQQAEPEEPPLTKTISRVHKRRESTTGSKRVVNGFICFRAYYCSLFDGLAQKLKSGLLRQMWGKESRRNIFGLLGRAFSDLRDHHAEVVTMERFLVVAAIAVPLVPAAEYLVMMGWVPEPILQEDGEMVLQRDLKFNVDIVNTQYPPQTRLSVADIVEHCYAHGFLDRASRRRPAPTDADRRPQGGSVNMAVAAAPPQQCFSLQVSQRSATVSTKSSPSHLYSSLPLMQIDEEIQHVVRRAESTASSSTGTPASNTTDSGLRDSNGYLTIDAVTADQQATYEQLEIGYHFHPRMAPVLGFDPRIVQDDFDPFDLDLSGYIDFDSEEKK
ncbi:hypothetical protein LTR84_002140 [Exophiala bonariae]|uniref:Alpha box domain-containing protein n=1 Tax=Exophiala bonariae TaxID=1690606 RepID=A0AAV9NBQ4_9EURO|nr:hypothetical protein LTR84_002140 [Exophiala bonariae]